MFKFTWVFTHCNCKQWEEKEEKKHQQTNDDANSVTKTQMYTNKLHMVNILFVYSTVYVVQTIAKHKNHLKVEQQQQQQKKNNSHTHRHTHSLFRKLSFNGRSLDEMLYFQEFAQSWFGFGKVCVPISKLWQPHGSASWLRNIWWRRHGQKTKFKVRWHICEHLSQNAWEK